MILILSTPTDNDTQAVIDWLHFKNADFFRLNDEDVMTGEVTFYYNSLQIQNSYLLYRKRKMFFRDFKVVWMRKFGFLKSYDDEFGRNNDLTRYIYSEFSVIRTLIFKLLEDKQWLFKRDNMLTKLEILFMADQCGLRTPNSLITNNKYILSSFLSHNNSSIISKSIRDGKHIVYKNKDYPFFTEKINNTEKLSEKFSPSLFQSYIDKMYELRIFLLDKTLYSMVIFSQNNEKTKIDFRNYDLDRPNRVGRYQLPKNIEKKLLKLMSKIGLNTGSIDMLKGIDGEYYFLEVNPSGQFGMTSIPCNYNLYEKIANYLINPSNE